LPGVDEVRSLLPDSKQLSVVEKSFCMEETIQGALKVQSSLLP